LRPFFQFFSSLRLTVTLLALAMVLIFLATLDQGQWGVYEVQHRYFETFLAVWHYPEQWPGADYFDRIPVPLPGGFLLGGLLVVNLLCAHFRHYRASLDRAGITLIHGGLLLLIVSGFATAYFQQEYYMWLNVGGRSDFIQSFRDVDLVLIDHTDPKDDLVVSIPSTRLQPGETISDPALPFTLRTVDYYPNSQFYLRSQNPGSPALNADQGVAQNRDIGVAPKSYDYVNDTENVASGIISIDSPSGHLGQWLVSTLFTGAMVPPFLAKSLPQTFTVNGHTWEIALRPRREYLNFWLYLDKFIHEKYPGTDVPRRFESEARLVNPDTHENRHLLIYMNHPLRYSGLTFYQASFSPNDSASMLQVVRNPGWILPYLAVLVVGLGLVFHFLLSLIRHLREESKLSAPAARTPDAAPSSPPSFPHSKLEVPEPTLPASP
jgi:Na+-transporting methylmalonyl-CoA/oxaloacetate decarboxylase gamma subunit